ncbi:unnamed protein product [Paramecium sonneborni]|uniref:Uncharacterized protein n=1 Tax=Paramecium sonneborni TaxID=65129 RepID=A0A8S1QJF4_9CILI|nr:unnamed protein product [Paramecium sonneborni]
MINCIDEKQSIKQKKLEIESQKPQTKELILSGIDMHTLVLLSHLQKDYNKQVDNVIQDCQHQILQCIQEFQLNYERIEEILEQRDLKNKNFSSKAQGVFYKIAQEEQFKYFHQLWNL